MKSSNRKHRIEVTDDKEIIKKCPKSAKIKGAGTDVIKIEGVTKLIGKTYTIIPDQIEAGTYMVAAAAAFVEKEAKIYCGLSRLP